MRLWTFLFRYIFRSTIFHVFISNCQPSCQNAQYAFLQGHIECIIYFDQHDMNPVSFSFHEKTTLKTGLNLFSIEKPQTELKRTISRPVRIFSVWPAPPRVSCGMLLFPLRETARQLGPPLTAWLPACSYLVAWMPTCCWKPVGKLLRLGRWGPNTTLCSALRVITHQCDNI